MEREHITPQGVSVFHDKNESIHSFCLCLYVRAGSLFETKKENGISHFFEHIVFKNIHYAMGENLYQTLDRCGLDFNASTYEEFIQFIITGAPAHFEEAAELAYFGAKILHPTCILPAKLNNIPVRLLNTMEPDAPGTLIYNQTEQGKIKAVAAKDGITAIKIKSGRMLLAYGFLRKVFEIFESYQTAIDMVTTSEVGVSVTIDNTKHLTEILDDLKKFGTVTVDEDMVIICVVGDLEWNKIGFESNAMEAMKNVPVRMISYGGSNYNISFLIKAEDKKQALQALSDSLFNNK